jgi:hypothetical protein
MRKILKFRYLDWARLLMIFIISIILVGITNIIGLLILGLNLKQIHTLDIIIEIIVLSGIITVLHYFLCMDDTIFKKFGFLLPNDITYYIFIFNKIDRKLKNEVSLEITCNEKEKLESEKFKHILSCPKFEENLKYSIDKILGYESKCLFLLLHTKDARKERKIYFNLSELNKKNLKTWWWSPDPIDKDWSFVEKIFLLISKNTIVILAISMILTLLLSIVLLFNPPINLIVDPPLIKENMTEGQEKLIVISIKNIGCDLSDLTLASSDNILMAKFKGRSNSSIESLPSGATKYANVTINYMPEGKYAGFININASREIKTIKSSQKTEIRTIYEIPFSIQIYKNPFNIQVKVNNLGMYKYYDNDSLPKVIDMAMKSGATLGELFISTTYIPKNSLTEIAEDLGNMKLNINFNKNISNAVSNQNVQVSSENNTSNVYLVTIKQSSGNTSEDIVIVKSLKSDQSNIYLPKFRGNFTSNQTHPNLSSHPVS